MSVLTDTLDGTLTWNPDAKLLERHLFDAIRFRVRDQARFKIRHVEDVYDEDASGQAIAPCMLGDVGDDFDLRTIADQVVPELQERAGDDPEVLLLLELFGDDLEERADLMTDAQMQCNRPTGDGAALERTRAQRPKRVSPDRRNKVRPVTPRSRPRAHVLALRRGASQSGWAPSLPA